MRPIGLPCPSITSSQASMHCAVPMHSGWRPRRMSVPVGQAFTQARQAMQSPASTPTRRSFSRTFGSPRFSSYATRIVSRSASTFCRRPYGHAIVHIWSRNQPKSKRMAPATNAITDRAPCPRGRVGREAADKRPPAGEVRDEGGRHQERDRRPDRPLRRLDGELPAAPRRQVQLPLLRRPALEERLDGPEEELEVDGLRAGVPAPHPPERRADEEDGDDDAEAERHEEEVVGRDGTCRRRRGCGGPRGRTGARDARRPGSAAARRRARTGRTRSRAGSSRTAPCG